MDLWIVAKLVFVRRDGSLDVQVATRLSVYLSMLSEKWNNDMEHQTLILDGGMGRELQRRGAPFRQPEWSALALMEAPEQVVAAAREVLNRDHAVTGYLMPEEGATQ